LSLCFPCLFCQKKKPQLVCLFLKPFNLNFHKLLKKHYLPVSIIFGRVRRLFFVST
jgi:hypothetical protein